MKKCVSVSGKTRTTGLLEKSPQRYYCKCASVVLWKMLIFHPMDSVPGKCSFSFQIKWHCSCALFTLFFCCCCRCCCHNSIYPFAYLSVFDVSKLICVAFDITNRRECAWMCPIKNKCLFENGLFFVFIIILALFGILSDTKIFVSV